MPIYLRSSKLVNYLYIDINRKFFPELIFFESTFQLANLFNEVKSISKLQIEEKKIATKISEDNLTDLFSYSNLIK